MTGFPAASTATRASDPAASEPMTPTGDAPSTAGVTVVRFVPLVVAVADTPAQSISCCTHDCTVDADGISVAGSEGRAPDQIARCLTSPGQPAVASPTSTRTTDGSVEGFASIDQGSTIVTLDAADPSLYVPLEVPVRVSRITAPPAGCADAEVPTSHEYESPVAASMPRTNARHLRSPGSHAIATWRLSSPTSITVPYPAES